MTINFDPRSNVVLTKLLMKTHLLRVNTIKNLKKNLLNFKTLCFVALVANGTDAIEIALKAFDIGHGDLVAIPGITFYATAEAVFNVGATPILVDVNPETMVMCPKSLERVIEENHVKSCNSRSYLRNSL